MPSKDRSWQKPLAAGSSLQNAHLERQPAAVDIGSATGRGRPQLACGGVPGERALHPACGLTPTPTQFTLCSSVLTQSCRARPWQRPWQGLTARLPRLRSRETHRRDPIRPRTTELSVRLRLQKLFSDTIPRRPESAERADGAGGTPVNAMPGCRRFRRARPRCPGRARWFRVGTQGRQVHPMLASRIGPRACKTRSIAASAYVARLARSLS